MKNAQTGKRRVALVVGGSSIIGGAIARRLADAGILVCVGYNERKAAAESVVKEIAANGDRAVALHVDVRNGAELDAVCAGIYETHGALDILVNCAGVNIEAPALGMNDKDWEAVVATNVSGAFRLCRAAAKFMLLGRWGRIVNISSVAGTSGGRGQINYAASKAALESMTRVLALELGRKGVLANCVAPGTIESGMSDRVRREYGGQMLDSIAVRRFGRAEDVAGAVGFLVSDAAGYITGQVIRVDGGMYL